MQTVWVVTAQDIIDYGSYGYEYTNFRVLGVYSTEEAAKVVTREIFRRDEEDFYMTRIFERIVDVDVDIEKG
jgi:hypothetical protein